MSNHDLEDSHSLDRDAAVDRAWRERSAEQPPSQLDAAIIAAARDSARPRARQPNPVPARNARNWLTQWQPLAAAAVVAALAFGLVQMLPHEQEPAPSLRWKESAPVPNAAEAQPPRQPQQQSSQPRPSQPRGSSTRERSDYRQPSDAKVDVGERERVAAPDGAPEQNAVPAPPVIPAAPTTAERAAAQGDVPRMTASDTASRAEATAAAAPSSRADEATRGNATRLDPQAWAAKVVALYESGDVTAAEHALREFRTAFADADAYLPDSLRSWARTME